MKKMYFVGLLIVVIVCLIVFYKDYLPPLTPIKLARITTKFKISNEASVIHFDSKTVSFDGDFYTELVLKLNKKDQITIITECLKREFKKLPIYNRPNGLFEKDNLSSSDKGFYKSMKKENGYEEVVVFNETKGQLVMFVLQL